MGIASIIRRALALPAARGVEVDGLEAIRLHRRIIESKPLLRDVHLAWYRECLPALEATRGVDGVLLEIGCGAGFLEEVVPNLTKTDCVPNPFAHSVMDAMSLDFPNGSLRAIFLVGVLHHVPEPELFLKEAARCLKPNGRIVMLEPNNCAIEKVLCRLTSHYEFFDDEVQDWRNSGSGRMTNANMALPWVIFVRDRAELERRFPELRIQSIRYHTFLSYYLSGGMSFRSIPAFTLPLVRAVERIAKPFMKSAGSLMTIELVRA